MLITSASTGENVNRLFASIEKLQHAADKRIGTGVLNRLLRQAFEANPPPIVKGRRLKLFYAAHNQGTAVSRPPKACWRNRLLPEKRDPICQPRNSSFL